MDEAFPAQSIVRPRRRHLLRRSAIVGIAVGSVVLVFLQRSTIAEGLRGLSELEWGWVVAASVAETLSMFAMAMLYRTLLLASGAKMRVRWLLSTVHAANLVSAFVPLIGPGIAGRQAYLQLREAGADPAPASLTLTIAGVGSMVAFASVPVTSAVLSGNLAAAVSGLVTAVVLVGGLWTVAWLSRTRTGQERLVRLLRGAVRVVQRCIRRPKSNADLVARNVVTSIGSIRLTRSGGAQALGWALLNWWCDIACLAFAIHAAGIDGLSFADTLLVWLAGVGVTSVSPTPAGIGAVEIAMAATFATLQRRGPAVITAILVYRIISLKLAGAAWGYLYRHVDRRRRSKV